MKKINIVELLKDCPKGMELDCTMYDNVTLIQVQGDNTYPIKIETPDGSTVLTKYGGVSYNKLSKCIIFPKGKTTWEGFQRPYEDGDIVASKNGQWIGITTGGKSDEPIPTYCVIKWNGDFEAYPNCKEKWRLDRLATEEEKQKLFQAIKDNGYYWNTETKTLEKLPKFKVGDKIQSVISSSYYTVVDIKNDLYFIKSDTEKYPYQVSFSNEINYKLVLDKFDITTLVPFESRVLMRSSNAREWVGTFYSHYSDNKFYGCGMCCDQCIPYERNEHLLGTTNDCDEYFKTWEE